MPLIPFPNIPSLPGVPLLPRLPGQAGAFVNKVGQAANAVQTTINTANRYINSLNNVAGILSGDDRSALGVGSSWGVYDQNFNPIARFDSFVSLEFDKEYRIANYPVEPNSFAAYNKVETPFSARVTFSKAGSLSDRAAFLRSIATAVNSTNLFLIMTPDANYPNANLVRYEFARQASRGVELLVVELHFQEVRLSAAVTFSNTKAPSGAANTNTGTCQAVAPNVTQLQAALAGAF